VSRVGSDQFQLVRQPQRWPLNPWGYRRIQPYAQSIVSGRQLVNPTFLPQSNRRGEPQVEPSSVTDPGSQISEHCMIHIVSHRSTLVIETGESAQVPSGVIYRWYGHGESNNYHSLLDYVENNSERLRHKYLKWVSDLGNTKHQERLLTDWLALDETLSYWWMTLIAERSIWKTPEIIDAIRLLALEEIITNLAPKQLILVSRDPILRSSIQQLCQDQSILFSWRHPIEDNKHHQRRYERYRTVPSVILALAMFARFIRRYWSLRRLRTWHFSEQDNAVLFATRTRYPGTPTSDTPMPHSLLWPDLPTLLNNKGIPNNWLEMLMLGIDSPSASDLSQQLDCYRKHYSENETHVFLDSLLSFRVIIRVLKLYLGLMSTF
ncbi:uncharacterized protein METZ01_LOCUS247874, partial [marine metagenome]